MERVILAIRSLSLTASVACDEKCLSTRTTGARAVRATRPEILRCHPPATQPAKAFESLDALEQICSLARCYPHAWRILLGSGPHGCST